MSQVNPIDKQPIFDRAVAKGRVQEKIADIYPPEGYLPKTNQYERLIPAGDRNFLWMGSIDCVVMELPEDDEFTRFSSYDNRGAKIPKGTHVAQITDINPFGYKAEMPSENEEAKGLRALAKLYMTVDFLRMIWKAEELDPQLELTYCLTNPAMARFMIKHWGFKTLREGDDQLLADPNEIEVSIVVTATKEDIEASYDHLEQYIDQLLQRV